MIGLRLTCPFCGREDLPIYTLEAGEHRILASWKPGVAGETCRFLECHPEIGKRTAKWWNDVHGCICSEPWKDCDRYQAKHPNVVEVDVSS